MAAIIYALGQALHCRSSVIINGLVRIEGEENKALSKAEKKKKKKKKTPLEKKEQKKKKNIDCGISKSSYYFQIDHVYICEKTPCLTSR